MKKPKKRTKWNFEKVRDKFEENGYELLETEYKGHKVKHKYVCPEGHEGEIVFKDFVAGNRCRKCGIRKRANSIKKTIEEVRKEFEDGGCILLTEEYINSNQKLEYICECGKEKTITRTHFLRGQRCRECGVKKIGASRRYGIDVARRAFELSDMELLENEYVDGDTPMRYKCKICGYESTAVLRTVIRGSRCRSCSYEDISGENNSRWSPYLTDEDRKKDRKIRGYQKWRDGVIKRDNNTCQSCNKTNCELNAHHLNSYDWCSEQRTDINNGITLCKTCHINFHNQYGYGGNTKEQFEEWIKLVNLENEKAVAQ